MFNPKTPADCAVRHVGRGCFKLNIGMAILNPSGDSEKLTGHIPNTISATSVNITGDNALQDSSGSFTDTDGKPVEFDLYHLKKISKH